MAVPCGPEPFGRLAQRGLAGLGRQVGDPGQQVQLADGMTGHRLGVADRYVVLEVLRAEAGLAEQTVAAAVDEVLRRVQVARLAGLAIQLDQRGLDLRVAADAVDLALAGAERRRDEVGEPAGDVEQPGSAVVRWTATAAWIRWPVQ